MANEPERPIEKLLRAAAQKRRDEAGAPFELHPATRRLLQGEVARRFARPRSEGRSLRFLLAQLRPRLAWGVAILAVLGVVVWLALPDTTRESSVALLARNEPVREATPARQMMPPAPTTPAVVPAPATEAPSSKATMVTYAERSQNQRRGLEVQRAAGQNQLAKENLRELPTNEAVDKSMPPVGAQRADRKRNAEAEITASSATVASAPAGSVSGASGQRYGFSGGSAPPGNAPTAPAAVAPVVGTPGPVTVLAAEDASKLKDADAGRQALAYKAPAEAAPVNREKAAPATADAIGGAYAASIKAEKSLGVAQRFARVATGPKAKLALADEPAAAPPVLASFQVEQSGSQLRIIDGDGSVYTGQLQILNTTRRSRGTQGSAALTTDAARAPKDALDEKPASRFESGQPLAQSYFFRVAGTNRSLNKKVVFTGNLLPGGYTNQAGLAGTNLGVANNFDALRTSPAQLRSVPLINARISGKVAVGNAKAVEINAEPTRP